MTTDNDVRRLVSRALDQMQSLIAAIPPGLVGAPTPCADWNVRGLVQHVAGQGLRNFVVAARGQITDWRAPAGELGDNWAAQFREGADALRAAWRDADLDRLVSGPGGQAPLHLRASQQITELTVHSWDLAVATGQRSGLDPRLAEYALVWSGKMLRPEYRGAGGFGEEVPVPEDAPVYDRLAGWFGRDPAWTPLL